jgi:hypothetical protein
LAAGCGGGSDASISGTVTLDGQPLAKGDITFSAEGGQGGTGGGSIVAGKYEVKQLPPGKYLVHIAGVPENKFIEPNSPEARKTYTDAEIRAMSDPIPAGTTGTDQKVELKAGAQTQDFALKSPGK